jgi:hypothetical protein
MKKHFVRLVKPKKSDVYDTYWSFAVKRHEDFFKRLSNPNGPWTDDPVIKNNRFTNVFRAADRVSQYLICLQYEDEHNLEEVFFKTILFKLFNKIETYAFLERQSGKVSFESFSFEKSDRLLMERMVAEHTIYSAAYIMPSAGGYFGYKFKHSNHLALLAKMMKDKAFVNILECKTLEEVYYILLAYPSIGSFLAYQYAIDLNYSRLIDFSEMDFVVAGPGAKNGILKCFDSPGDYTFEDIIRLMADTQEEECLRLGLSLPTLLGRRLQLIDCQNLFCEVDKYLRVTNPGVTVGSGRTRIKQKFSISKGAMTFFFPPKWGINHKIKSQWQMKVNEDIFL